MEEPIKVVFILGSGHSGSTILDLLLNAHPDIVGLGEAEKIGVKVANPENHCSCGKDFVECPFWGPYVNAPEQQAFLKKQVRHIYQSKLDFLLGRKHYRFLEYGEGHTTPEEYVRASESLYRYALEKSGAHVVVDSTKGAFRPEALLRYGANVELYIIHLVRDGRGVVWSYKKKYPGTLSWVMRWVLSNLKVAILRSRIQARSRRITYEALVADPKALVTSIVRDLGLDEGKWNPDFRSVAHHYIAGNFLATASDAAIQADVAWKHEMPHTTRIMFALTAGWLNWYYQHFTR